MPTRSIPTPSTASTSTTTAIASPTSRSATCSQRRKTANRPSTSLSQKARRPARVEAVGTKIIADADVSFSAKPNIVKSGAYTFFAGARSDAFFFDFDGIKNLFDTSGGRNFTAPHLGGKSPWTGVDSNTEANVFSTVIELPTSELGANPEIRIWGRCSVRENGKLHPRRSRRPPEGQQLFQHRRDQAGIQRQRTGQRSQALDWISSST